MKVCKSGLRPSAKIRIQMNINDALIHKLELSTGLKYNAADTASNLCYANANNDLRDEFKEVFGRNDVLCFLKAVPDTDSPTAEEFWKWVKIGKSRINDHPS